MSQGGSKGQGEGMWGGPCRGWFDLLSPQWPLSHHLCPGFDLLVKLLLVAVLREETARGPGMDAGTAEETWAEELLPWVSFLLIPVPSLPLSPRSHKSPPSPSLLSETWEVTSSHPTYTFIHTCIPFPLD